MWEQQQRRQHQHQQQPLVGKHIHKILIANPSGVVFFIITGMYTRVCVLQFKFFFHFYSFVNVAFTPRDPRTYMKQKHNEAEDKRWTIWTSSCSNFMMLLNWPAAFGMLRAALHRTAPRPNHVKRQLHLSCAWSACVTMLLTLLQCSTTTTHKEEEERVFCFVEFLRTRRGIRSFKICNKGPLQPLGVRQPQWNCGDLEPPCKLLTTIPV